MFNEIKDIKIRNYGQKNINHRDQKNELIYTSVNIKEDFINSIRQWKYQKKIEKLKGNLNKIR